MSLLSQVLEDEESKPVSSILFGRYMLPDRTEHASQIKDISPTEATFSCAAPPQIGDHIIAYIEEIGRVEGDVATVTTTEFHVEFTVPESKRNKIAAKLNWMQTNAEEGSSEQRRHARFEPDAGNTVLTMPDGRQYGCEVLDMSLSGAAIRVSVIPSIGTNVTLGKMRGTVTRIHECGFALEFNHLLDEPDLHKHLS